MLIFGVFVYKDVRELQERLPSEPKLFLIVDSTKQFYDFDKSEDLFDFLELENQGLLKDHYISAFELNDMTADQEPTFLTKNEINFFNQKYYKKFLIDLRTLKQNLPKTIYFDDLEIPGMKFMEIMMSADPRWNFLESFSEELLPENFNMLSSKVQEDLVMQMGESEEFRSELSAVLFSRILQEQGSIFLIRSLHTQDVIILPETITFKFIKTIPSELIEILDEKLKEQI